MSGRDPATRVARLAADRQRGLQTAGPRREPTCYNDATHERGTALATHRGAPMRATNKRRTGTISRIALALVGTLALSACARHDVRPAFRSGVFIDGRGISVPLPPPSLFEAPKQSVDVDVEVDGEDLPGGTELTIVDNEGDAERTVVLDDEASVTLEGLEIDLTSNCLELWLTDGDRESDHALFQATIGEDDQTVETQQGC